MTRNQHIIHPTSPPQNKLKVFFAVDSDVSLLPHFLSHYRELGATEFHCASLCDIAIAATDDTFVLYRTDLDPAMHFYDSLHDKLMRVVKQTVKPGEWFIIAELDEFHKYPENVFSLIEKMNWYRADCYFGDIVDRIAADGKLPELTDAPIASQFPCDADITGNVMGACTKKVMLCRGYKEIGGGNHGIASSHFKYKEEGIVYHYKWHAEGLRRIQERLKSLKQEGSQWWVEPERFLRYWYGFGDLTRTKR